MDSLIKFFIILLFLYVIISILMTVYSFNNIENTIKKNMVTFNPLNIPEPLDYSETTK